MFHGMTNSWSPFSPSVSEKYIQEMGLYPGILFLSPLPLFSVLSLLCLPSLLPLHPSCVLSPCPLLEMSVLSFIMIPLGRCSKDVLWPVSETLCNLKFYTLVCDSGKLMIVARVVVLLSFRGVFLTSHEAFLPPMFYLWYISRYTI